MVDFDFDGFLARAQDELEQKQQHLSAEYGLGSWPRFVVDYVAGTLQFFEHEALRVETTIISVATHVPAEESLKWAWANDRYPESVRTVSARIKGLHDVTGLQIFANESVQCDEVMAWEITALACKFLEARGAYRVPHGQIDSYVLISEIRKVA
jgi:hypothetical protein